jgi:predicted dehydrogenase
MSPANKTNQDNNSSDSVVPRRTFVAATAAAVTASQAAVLWGQRSDVKHRVAVIGHTGRGNYGHGLDRVWLEIPGCQIVGVADANPEGLARTAKRVGEPKAYPDYRKMLDEVKPDLVSVAPRWLDQHCDMVLAAAERGVRGIYLEKPMCRTLEEADRMVAACEKHKVKLAMAHQTRYSPKLKVMRDMIERGDLGQIVEIRARGKDDHRGGGEDLWVLGTHMLNLTSHFGGAPKSCFGTVWQEGRPIGATDVVEGNEGIGPLAGDEVHAMYRLTNNVTGYFDSVRNRRGRQTRFGIRIFGSQGVFHLHETGYLPAVHYLPDSGWSPGRTGKQWVAVSSEGPGKPEPITAGDLHAGNIAAVKDLIASIEEDRQPVSNIYEARAATEMIVAVFESQRVGCPVTFPLKTRCNPLTLLG